MNDTLTPIAVVEHDGEPWVEWCDLRGITLDDPFFEQTVARALAEPHRRASRRRTPLVSLAPACDRVGQVPQNVW